MHEEIEIKRGNQPSSKSDRWKTQSLDPETHSSQSKFLTVSGGAQGLGHMRAGLRMLEHGHGGRAPWDDLAGWGMLSPGLRAVLSPGRGLGNRVGSEEGGSLWGFLGGGLTRPTPSCGLWMPLLLPQSSFLSKGSLPDHDSLQLRWVPLDSHEIKKWMNAPKLDSSAPPGLAQFNTLQWDPFSTSILSLNFTHISPQGIHSPFLVRVLIRLMKRGNFIQAIPTSQSLSSDKWAWQLESISPRSWSEPEMRQPAMALVTDPSPKWVCKSFLSFSLHSLSYSSFFQNSPLPWCQPELPSVTCNQRSLRNTYAPLGLKKGKVRIGKEMSLTQHQFHLHLDLILPSLLFMSFCDDLP